MKRVTPSRCEREVVLHAADLLISNEKKMAAYRKKRKAAKRNPRLDHTEVKPPVLLCPDDYFQRELPRTGWWRICGLMRLAMDDACMRGFTPRSI